MEAGDAGAGEKGKPGYDPVQPVLWVAAGGDRDDLYIGVSAAVRPGNERIRRYTVRSFEKINGDFPLRIDSNYKEGI